MSKKNKKKSNKRINNLILGKSDKRIKILFIFMMICFLVIVIRLGYLIIFKGNYYRNELKEMTANIVYGDSAPRGKIYDCNMKLLVDNVPVKSIYYKKLKGVTIEKEIELAYFLIEKLDLDYEAVSLRNLKEFYIIKYKEETDKLITLNEYKNLDNRLITSDDIYELKIDRISDADLNKLDDKDKRVAYLYYLMNKDYYYSLKEIKTKNVTDLEYAYINENIDNLYGFNTKLEWERVYIYDDTLKGVIGKISSREIGIPKEDMKYYLSLGYTLNDRVGISGLEKQYESILVGKKAKYRVLDDNTLELIEEGKRGNDIVLSIDIDLQLEIDKMLEEELLKTKKEPNTEFYNRSFIVIENPSTGEIYSINGKQILYNSLLKEYEIFDFSEGSIVSTITAGSVVKGASSTVGYKEGVIDIGTTMVDKCIKLYATPSKCSWKTLGKIDDIEALKYSSNVYQYMIAMRVGGFEYKYNKKLDMDLSAFDKYRKTFNEYGLGVKTEIDFPIEEDGYIGDSSSGELLINFAIGQYDTYTTMQLSQYISTIANNGDRVKTHFLKKVLDNNGEVVDEIDSVVLNKVDIDSKYMKRIQDGLVLVMKSGTGRFGYMGKSPRPAGKTGTSESFVDVNGDGIIDYESISNNFVGYAPYDKPVMSIAVSSPDVQNPNRGSYKSSVNLRISGKASDLFFKFYDESGNRK